MCDVWVAVCKPFVKRIMMMMMMMMVMMGTLLK